MVATLHQSLRGPRPKYGTAWPSAVKISATSRPSTCIDLTYEDAGGQLRRPPQALYCVLIAGLPRLPSPPHQLTDDERAQLTDVVLGYIGPCDVVAARQGLDWMRERYRGRGERPPF